MSKKIICIIEGLGSGGAERQIVGLASLLRQHSYNVEVWAYYPYDFYCKVLGDNHVPYRYIAEAQSNKKRYRVLKKELRKASPDIVISYSSTSSTLLGFMKMMGEKYKVIVSERNTTQKLNLREFVKFVSYMFVNKIVSNSHSQANYIGNLFLGLKNKVTTITNFVDTDFFAPATRINRERKRILVVGRMMEQKNIERFLHAIAILKDSRNDFFVEWYGRNNHDDYSNRCIDLLHSLKLKDVFSFKNATTEIVEQYQSSDIFCLPSLFEGYPNVVCEAMSCGLPVVCSNVCDNPYIVKDGVNGLLFAPLNLKSMADALSCFLSLSDEERCAWGRNSRLIAVELFSKDKFIKSYIQLIDSL